MSRPAGASAYALAYEVAPIALVGGIAANIPGGVISALSLLQSITFGGLDGDGDVEIDRTFATFRPLPGSSLIDGVYGTYPFANLTVASNARVAQPVTISMLMMSPVREAGGYAMKTAVMTALKNTLDQHVQQGGYFSVATPAFFYNNALLLRIHDVTQDDIKAQETYQWDFFCPLITLEQAQATQNAMMSLLSSGGQTSGALSGVDPATGQPVTTGTPDVSPAATGAINSQVGGPSAWGSQIPGSAPILTSGNFS